MFHLWAPCGSGPSGEDRNVCLSLSDSGTVSPSKEIAAGIRNVDSSVESVIPSLNCLFDGIS